MGKILVVEDEASIREVERAYLERAGHIVIEAETGTEAMAKFKANVFDLIILDLNLPEIDGISVCKKIRTNSQVPIIMVTARTEEIDEIIGLEIGADDYIKKPFSPNILVSRAAVLMRRNKPGKMTLGNLALDPERLMVTVDNIEKQLTYTQFNVLYTLAKRPGIILTREQILQEVNRDPAYVETMERTVDAHIKAVRKAIEPDHKHPQYILTVIGMGYKFNDQYHEIG